MRACMIVHCAARTHAVCVGQVRGIPELNVWPLVDVLIEKYKIDPTEAHGINAFLSPMLELDARKRASAATCLQSSWLPAD